MQILDITFEVYLVVLPCQPIHARRREHPVDHVYATESLTDEEKSAILGGNAARLFGMNG